MFTIIAGGSLDFIKECREAAKNVSVKILAEVSSIEDTTPLIDKFAPHAVIITSEWAPKAASWAREHRNTKIFVSGGIEKSWRDEWDEKGLPIFVVSGKIYKALLELEAHLKFTSPTNFHPEKQGKAAELPKGFFFYEGFTPIHELVGKSPVAVLVEAGEGVIETIKALRREYRLSSVPVVVVGKCESTGCYRAGADECVEDLNSETVERIRVRANKMREMWKMATRDDLTGLYKRVFLNDYLKEQERRYQETGVPFSVMMADLDYFKEVNDTHGHQAGDTVLKEFASFLSSGTRKADIVARYGGEEFVVVFPNLENVRTIAEKLCRGWAAKEIRLQEGIRIKSTFSAGLATMGRDAGDGEGLLAAADRALYLAKEYGRNMVKDISSEHGEVEVFKENLPFKAFKKKGIGFEKKIRAPADIEYAIDEIKRHKVIVVWNLDGWGKAESAIEITVKLQKHKRRILLVEMDFLNPAIDRIAGIPIVKKKDIPGKSVTEIGAGLLTLGSQLQPDHTVGLIRPKLKVDYLAAGNDLGVTGEYAGEQVYHDMVALLAKQYDHVVIDLGVNTDNQVFRGVVKRADILVIPASNNSVTYTRYEKIVSVKEAVFVKRS
ncbi:Response regulator PleD [Pelotomaculum schinkii]|uniref:Response regulator PleD n=1 Tax=Pelotomaculum schinkii TaxID=78350 RepID=A0A4Y7R7K6_9FIRM|nr:diguanylate cyclase [Pelotomaculum schinkii]TEB04699.1 Response regulator PleD [Pelotomaculum schinkii]